MKKGLSIAIIIVVVALLGVGVFGFITKSSSSTGEIVSSVVSTFYIEIDGKKITSSADGYLIGHGNPLEVAVKYPFAKVNNQSTDYSVKIVPSGKVDFEFLAGNEVHKFKDETDVSELFTIEKGETSFVINVRLDFADMFSILYPTMDVYVDFSTLTADNRNMFRLIVTSSDDQTVQVDFSCYVPTEGITLDQEEIMF